MTTLVVGDVHGCADELASLLDAVRPSRCVLVGDLFTKGPDPAGVFSLVVESGLESVRGNHDQALLDHVDGVKRRRDADAVIAALDAGEGAWLRFLRGLPLFIEAPPFTVVHAALHPSGDLALTPPAVALSLRRWPDDRPSDPSWQAVYTGVRRVVFGHDAVRGLVRIERHGLPWLVGLDTGCVYGRQLSGYIVEEDRLVQVAARRVYRPVGPPAG